MLVNSPDIVVSTFRLRVIAIITANVAAVITVKPVFGAEPHESELVLMDSFDGVRRKAVAVFNTRNRKTMTRMRSRLQNSTGRNMVSKKISRDFIYVRIIMDTGAERAVSEANVPLCALPYHHR